MWSYIYIYIHHCKKKKKKKQNFCLFIVCFVFRSWFFWVQGPQPCSNNSRHTWCAWKYPGIRWSWHYLFLAFQEAASSTLLRSAMIQWVSGYISNLGVWKKERIAVYSLPCSHPCNVRPGLPLLCHSCIGQHAAVRLVRHIRVRLGLQESLDHFQCTRHGCPVLVLSLQTVLVVAWPKQKKKRCPIGPAVGNNMFPTNSEVPVKQRSSKGFPVRQLSEIPEPCGIPTWL